MSEIESATGADPVAITTAALHAIFPREVAEEMSTAWHLARFARLVLAAAQELGVSPTEVLRRLGNPTRYFAPTRRHRHGRHACTSPAMFLPSRLEIHLNKP